MSSEAPLAVGVDLGTTYTCAAVSDGGTARVVQLSGTSQTVPSVVSITEDGVLAGESAERRLVSHPSTTAREFKRRLGDATPIVLGSDAFPAEVLSGHLLREVLDRVERNEGTAPSVVGLAHPASWGPFRLDLLRDAARHAGVDDVVLVPEPVAAAIANRDRVEPGSLVAVYDLGGGTFDAAIVRVGSADDPSAVEVVGTPEGVERLGGIDFDQAVMAHVDTVLGGQVFGLDRSDPDARGALMRLRSECQAAKEHLSQDSDVDIPVALPGLQTSVRMTRGEFEAAVRPRLSDSLAVFDRVAASAGSGWDDISAVLLVGGSSNIPVVAQIVAEHTGRPVVTATSPHLAIAAGTAAVAARSLAPAATEPTTPLATAATATAGQSTETPSSGAVAGGSGGSNRLAIVAGVLAVVALAIGAFVVLGGGDDDPAADEPDISEPDTSDPDTTDPETSEPDTTEPETSEPDTTEPETSEPDTTEPDTGEPPAAAVTIDSCTTVDAATVAVLATDGGAVVVDADAARLVAGLGPSDCSVDPAGGDDLGLALPGPATGGSSFGPLFSVSTDQGGLIGSTDSGASRACDLVTGPTAMTDGGAVFPIDGDGVVTRVRTANGNCDVQPDDRLDGIAATAVGVAGSQQLAVGGTADGSIVLRVFVDGETASDLSAQDLGGDVAGIDAVVRCGDAWCVFDLGTQSVHVVDRNAVYQGSASLDGGPLAGAGAIRSASPSSDGPALVTAEGADGSIVVVTVAA